MRLLRMSYRLVSNTIVATHARVASRRIVCSQLLSRVYPASAVAGVRARQVVYSTLTSIYTHADTPQNLPYKHKRTPSREPSSIPVLRYKISSVREHAGSRGRPFTGTL